MSEEQATYLPDNIRAGLLMYKTDRTASGDVLQAVNQFMIAHGHAPTNLSCNACAGDMMNRAVNIFLKDE